MSETAERIWAARGMYTVQPDNRWPSPEPYIRLDLHEAEVAKLRDERDEAMERETIAADAAVGYLERAEKAEAEAQAHKSVIGAKDRVDAHKRDIERLRQIRYQFVAEFKGLLAKFGSMLKSLEAPADESENEKEREDCR